jgi:hypothetical protein
LFVCFVRCVCELALWISSLSGFLHSQNLLGEEGGDDLGLDLSCDFDSESKKKNIPLSNCCEVGIKIDDNCRCL